ncbi:MAG TPA: hypothetical protein V6D17_16690, partial [Candidatus Obscuribacterales bacterium]
MAPPLELSDPFGYPVSGPGYDGYSAMYNDAYQAIGMPPQMLGGWPEAGNYYDYMRAENFQNGYFDFTGDLGPQREQLNNYRNPRTFDDPYRRLEAAHRMALYYGPEAARGAYEQAIAAADRIPQHAVARDMHSNMQQLRMLSRDMDDAFRMGMPPMYMQHLMRRQQRLLQEQRRLWELRMAPAVARANAGFAFIGSTNDNLSSYGERLVEQALNIRPELDTDYWFNFHRDEAYRQRDRRRQELRRASNPQDLPKQPK